MKTLQESLLDDVDVLAKTNDNTIIDIFMRKNYSIKGKIHYHDNIVDINGDIQLKNNINNLTDGLFKFGKVGGDFSCKYCDNLSSLEGAPEEVGGIFYCAYCNNLTSLEGAPKYVKGGFYCQGCNNLKSLKGAPKKVDGNFNCSGCTNLKTLEGGPKEVGGTFDCSDCPKLKSTTYKYSVGKQIIK